MSGFDRYLLSQFLAVFGFFSLLLVSIYWVNQAVGLFDRLIGDGQSALVFVEFSLLTLPNAIRLVLPVAAFAAAVHVTNRLAGDNELAVMQATGFSSFRLARPVLWFGVAVMLMMAVLTNVLVPASRIALQNRSAEIADNITARFLRDGQFLHPTDGITLYVREISQTGELYDIFLSDDRNPARTQTYTARKALLARSDQGPKLLMFDGMTQSLGRDSRQLAVTRFSDVTYDLSGLLNIRDDDKRTPETVPTGELLAASPALMEETGATRAALLKEGHSRIASPLLAIAAALVGFSTLLIGAYSRLGLWKQILGAIGILIVLQLVYTQGAGLALRSASDWPAVYAAPGLGIGLGVVLLWWSQRPRMLRRRTAAQAAS